jgi:hypothetical protein
VVALAATAAIASAKTPAVIFVLIMLSNVRF